MLTKQKAVEEFGETQCAFDHHSLTVRREDGARWTAPKVTHFGKAVYDFTGFQLPGNGLTRINVSSENPEIIERLEELLAGPLSPLPVDDGGHLHYVSVEVLSRDTDDHPLLAAWSFIPEAGDPEKWELYIWLAAVGTKNSTSSPRIYTSLTEAGMWRAVREGESIAELPGADTSFEHWLVANGRSISYGRQSVTR